MNILHAVSLVFAVASVSTRPLATEDQIIFQDKEQNIVVHFAQSRSGTVEFWSHLPAGWTFEIRIDGDQNGVWGVGSGTPTAPIQTSPDRKFAQDSRNGIFCSQYIFTSAKENPAEVYASSECGALPSKGHVELSGLDRSNRATIKYVLPVGELFGRAFTSHIQVCVWDTNRLSCQHSISDPLVLHRR